MRAASSGPEPSSTVMIDNGISEYKIGNESLIEVLPNASSRLLGLLEKQGKSDYGALRVAVVGGGCSGLQYKMDLVDGPVERDIMK